MSEYLFGSTTNAVTLLEEFIVKRIQKANQPHKTCIVCQRPFSWRKKWRNCWEEIQYCSNGCRKRKPSTTKKMVSNNTIDDQSTGNS